MGVEVLQPGAMSTLQDLGRFGSQNLGVFVSGAMDQVSHRLASMIVGNPPQEPTIECTLMGPTLLFKKTARIAICGADLSPTIDGVKVRMAAPVVVPAGSEVAFGQRRYGARAYLGVAGGFDIEHVLGSGSTSLKAGFGGYRGRSLRIGDRIGIKEAPWESGTRTQLRRSSDRSGFPPSELSVLNHQRVRVVRGRHWESFTEQAIARFLTEGFRISPQANRMGYRLDTSPLPFRQRIEMISEPVRYGTVQVPADGQPIILMADRQTVGGYPKIAEVITADLPRLAQFMPGEIIYFDLVEVQEARRIYLSQEAALTSLEQGS